MTTPDHPCSWTILPDKATDAMVEAGAFAFGEAACFAAVWNAMRRRAPSYHSSWSDKPPTEQGWYWHWNGNPEARPVPTSVLFSGSRNACFVSAGQLGLKEAVFCDQYGGYWLPLVEPDVPEGIG